MDRMKIALTVIVLSWCFSTAVQADDGTYSPAYTTSPSAELRTIGPSATVVSSPTPVTAADMTQPEVTCTLKITLPTNTQAPMDVMFKASGAIDGKSVTEFRYVFGDGESATGSGEMKHAYVQSGTYQARVTPVVETGINTPICKGAITVAAPSVTPTPRTSPSPSPTATPTTEIASSASTVTEQPKTGPGSWYWVSLGSLFTVWLGALTWYQRQHPQIG